MYASLQLRLLIILQRHVTTDFPDHEPVKFFVEKPGTASGRTQQHEHDGKQPRIAEPL